MDNDCFIERSDRNRPVHNNVFALLAVDNQLFNTFVQQRFQHADTGGFVSASSANTNVVCQALRRPADSNTPDDNVSFTRRTWTTLTWRLFYVNVDNVSARWRNKSRATAQIFFAVWQRKFRKIGDEENFKNVTRTIWPRWTSFRSAESLDDLNQTLTWTLTRLRNQNSFTWTRTRQQNVAVDLRQVVNKKVSVDAPEHTTICLCQLRGEVLVCSLVFLISFTHGDRTRLRKPQPS